MICLVGVLGFCGVFNDPTVHTAQRKSNQNVQYTVVLEKEDTEKEQVYFVEEGKKVRCRD